MYKPPGFINEFDINGRPFCFGNISKDFTVDNLRKTWLNGYVYDYFVRHCIIDIRDITDIHKRLMKNESCTVRPTPIHLKSDELHYFPFMVSLDRYDSCCNTVEDPFSRICFSNKVKGINLKVFNMIQGINKNTFETLMKQILW